MLRFLYFYIRSMRLYYGFVTATTVLAGLACWHLFNQTTIVWTLRDAALIAMGFFAWGFNQIFSDWFDRKEDAINAPHRPMVTGELTPRPAFALSALGLATIAAAGFMLSPWTRRKSRTCSTPSRRGLWRWRKNEVPEADRR